VFDVDEVQKRISSMQRENLERLRAQRRLLSWKESSADWFATLLNPPWIVLLQIVCFQAWFAECAGHT
jgi:hypothetical protein